MTENFDLPCSRLYDLSLFKGNSQPSETDEKKKLKILFVPTRTRQKKPNLLCGEIAFSVHLSMTQPGDMKKNPITW